MTEELRECYRLLELEAGASRDAVKAAYLELVKVWHPDRFPNDPKFQKRATEKTKALNEAYEKATAYLAGNYTESRASAKARAAQEEARRGRETAEAQRREEAARKAKEASELRAREEARLKTKQSREAEEQAKRQQEARAHPDRVAMPPRVPPMVQNERTTQPATVEPQWWNFRKFIMTTALILVALPYWSWWQFGAPRYVFWSDHQRTKWKAEGGDAWAQTKLGWMYDTGKGVPKNYEEAYRWYSLAARQGDATAQNNLGVMYHNGQAVPRDDVEAYKWYCLSAAKGNTNATWNRDMLMNELTPEQVAEARRLASNPDSVAESVAEVEFERDFFNRYSDLKPYPSLVEDIGSKILANAHSDQSREAVMETIANAARLEIKRREQIPRN